MKQIACLISIVTLLVSSCATSTQILSRPPGAAVYVDGQRLGRAPVTQTDSALLGATKPVLLTLDGYQDRHGFIRKDELKIGTLIGGIIFIVPLLWVTGYPDEHLFELEPIPDATRQ